MRFLRFAVGVIGFCFCVIPSRAQENLSATGADSFPPGTIWFNTDSPLSFENLSDKIVVIVITGEACVECDYYIQALKRSVARTPAVQIIQLLQGDQKAPVSRQHLLQYIQQKGLDHPIGVIPDLKAFESNITALPYFLLYEKSASSMLNGASQDGFQAVSRRLDEIKADAAMLATCANFQVVPSIDLHWYANPVIETPTYITPDENGAGIFVNDAAHNRIVALDADGNCTQVIGTTTQGFSDDALLNSSFNHPGGMVHFNGKLFVADTYNNRLRKVDFANQKVTTVLGNGVLSNEKLKHADGVFSAIGLPTDVEVWGSKLYIALAGSNQLLEMDEDETARRFANLPDTKNGLTNVFPVNLSAGSKFLYVVMSDGAVLKVDRKANVSVLDSDGHKFLSVCEWKGGLAGTTSEGRLYFLEKEKWKVVGDEKGKKNSIALSHANDLCVLNGDLIIADTENSMIREIGSASDKLAKVFWLKLSQELIGFEAASSSGDMIEMDTVRLGSGTTRVNVLLDLGGYSLVKEGQNEVGIVEVGSKAKLVSEQLTDKGFSFSVKDEAEGYDVYVELYMTLESPEYAGVYLIKRAYLFFTLANTGDATAVQEQIYTPNLLPN